MTLSSLVRAAINSAIELNTSSAFLRVGTEGLRFKRRNCIVNFLMGPAVLKRKELISEELLEVWDFLAKSGCTFYMERQYRFGVQTLVIQVDNPREGSSDI
jgi:hypothetical protein